MSGRSRSGFPVAEIAVGASIALALALMMTPYVAVGYLIGLLVVIAIRAVLAWEDEE